MGGCRWEVRLRCRVDRWLFVQAHPACNLRSQPAGTRPQAITAQHRGAIQRGSGAVAAPSRAAPPASPCRHTVYARLQRLQRGTAAHAHVATPQPQRARQDGAKAGAAGCGGEAARSRLGRETSARVCVNIIRCCARLPSAKIWEGSSSSCPDTNPRSPARTRAGAPAHAARARRYHATPPRYVATRRAARALIR